MGVTLGWFRLGKGGMGKGGMGKGGMGEVLHDRARCLKCSAAVWAVSALLGGGLKPRRTSG